MNRSYQAERREEGLAGRGSHTQNAVGNLLDTFGIANSLALLEVGYKVRINRKRADSIPGGGRGWRPCNCMALITLPAHFVF